MATPDNEARAYLRKLDDAVKTIRAEVTLLSDALRRVNSNQGYISFKEKKIREAKKAAPAFYVQEQAFLGGTTARTPMVINTDPRGWFFAERICASWRPTAGVYAGLWHAASSDNPAIVNAAAVGGAVVADVFDFYWEYAEGSSQLMRSNLPVPGTMLYRGDMDGFVPGSDGWPPSTSVTFYITPIGAGPGNNGVFNITIGGIQCYSTDM